MRVAALYDIHGNLPALEAVVREVHRAKVDRVVVGGDVVPGPMPHECLALLRQLDVPVVSIRGNGESAVLAELADAPGFRPDAILSRRQTRISVSIPTASATRRSRRPADWRR